MAYSNSSTTNNNSTTSFSGATFNLPNVVDARTMLLELQSIANSMGTSLLGA